MGAWISPYLVKEMKKMEERESGAEERERRSWGFWKTERKGGIYSGEGT